MYRALKSSYTCECMQLETLNLKPAKTEEVTPAAMEGVLASFLNIGKRSMWQQLTGAQAHEIALELVSVEQKVPQ